MEILINIKCDNAAFTERGGLEVARILRDLAEKIEDYPLEDLSMKLRDSNGNTVGLCKMEED